MSTDTKIVCESNVKFQFHAEKIIANAMLIIHFQEGINWMNIIYADYSIYHNSIDICTYAGYILRIAMKWQSAFKKSSRKIRVEYHGYAL